MPANYLHTPHHFFSVYCTQKHSIKKLSMYNKPRQEHSCTIRSIHVILNKNPTLGLNSRYSVLLGLTDNLFDVIYENASLIQDSIAKRAK